jgi:hypothetical protein
MKHFKRHFPVGPSSRNRRETYRIDETSQDGSGLSRDDGSQQKEPQLEDLTSPLAGTGALDRKGRV